jgi:hypothetical protein
MQRLVKALAQQFVADYLADPAGFMAAVDAGVHYERPKPERKTCVYRHFDAAGQLLYVGSSVSPKSRRHGHSSSSPWYSQSVCMTEEWFDSQREALDAELRAIKAEGPIYNLQGKPKERLHHAR